MTVLLGCVLVGVLFRDLLGVDLESTLWADDFDANFMRWTTGWVFDTLARGGTLEDVWNANAFFPRHHTLAYSDSMLGFLPFIAPARLLGLGYLTSLYVAMAGQVLVGFCATVAVLRKAWGLSAGESLLVSSVAHFGLSTTAFLGHYQLFGLTLGPTFLLAAAWYLRTFSWAALLIALSSFCWSVCSATYAAPMLTALFLLAVLPASITTTIAALRRTRWSKIVLQAGLGAVFACLLYFVQLAPYLEVAPEFPRQDYAETEQYSAKPHSVFRERSIHSRWYSPGAYRDYGDWERAYFPGFVLLIATAALPGWLATRRGQPYRRLALASQQLLAVLAAVAAVAWVLSWGPTVYGVWSPYRALAKLVPGLRDVRAPGRFGMFLGLPLGFFCVVLLKSVRPSGWASRVMLLVVGATLAVEQLPVFSTFAYAAPDVSVYEAVSRHIVPGTPILEMPLAEREHMQTIRAFMGQLNGSLQHRGRIVAGYGAKTTPELQKAIDLERRVFDGPGTLDPLLAYARQLGVAKLLVRWRSIPDGAAPRVRSELNESSELDLVEERADYSLFTLRVLK